MYLVQDQKKGTFLPFYIYGHVSNDSSETGVFKERVCVRGRVQESGGGEESCGEGWRGEREREREREGDVSLSFSQLKHVFLFSWLILTCSVYCTIPRYPLPTLIRANSVANSSTEVNLC